MPTFYEGDRPDELSDLAALDIALSPIYPLPGEETILEIKVGNRAAHRETDVEVSFLVGRREIQTTRITVEPESISTTRLSWVAYTPGAHTLTAKVDPNQRLVEQDRFDNAVSTEIVVVDRPHKKADFAVSDVKLHLTPEGATMIHVEVANYGKVEATTPLTIFANDQVVAVRIVEALAPQRSAIIEAPWSGQGQIRKIAAEINPRFKDQERNPNDNYFVRDLRPQRELTIEALSLTTSKPESNTAHHITISFRVSNTGRESIAESILIGIFPGDVTRETTKYVPDTSKTGASAPAPGEAVYVTRYVPDTFEMRAPAPAPGEAVYLSRRVRLPSGMNEFGVKVIIDPDNSVTPADADKKTRFLNFSNPSADIGRWVSIGPRRIVAGLGAVGRLHQIAIHPDDPETIYVASGGKSGSGVWKTTDGGSVWSPTTDSIGTLQVKAMAQDPSNPSQLYIGTPLGIYRTIDGGTSWTRISLDPNFSLSNRDEVLIIHPDDPDKLYLTSPNGVLGSEDGGMNWSTLLNVGSATDLVIDPSSPNRLYAGIQNDADLSITGVYETEDGGASWIKQSGCPGGRLPLPTSPTTIKLALSGSRVYASFRSASEVSWTLYRTTGVSCSIGGRAERMWGEGMESHRFHWNGPHRQQTLERDPR